MRCENALEPETAVRMYYEYPNGLGTEQLKQLFDVSSDSQVSQIRKEIRKIMTETGRYVWDKKKVNTACAFEYAGLNITEQEALCEKRKSLGIR